MAVRFRTFQIYAAFSTVLVFAGVTALSWYIGVQRSLSDWQTDHGVEFDDFLSERLSRLMLQADPVDPALIADYLTPYLDPTLYAIVFDASDRLIYWTWKGDHWYWRPDSNASLGQLSEEARLSGLMAEDSPINLETIPENSIGLAGQLRMEGILQEVVVGGSRVGGFAAGSNGFTVNRTNRRLFEQLALGAMLGLAAAIVLSVAIAGIFNRRLGRSIRAITKSMGSVAAGSRTEPFPELQITELNDISGSAAALQLRLAQEERLRRQWTMDLAHDLRTPIANIRAQAEAMSDGLLEPGARRLENLAINARHLSQLADNLLLLARMESPEYELNLTEVALGDLASTIYSAFDARMAEENRTLSVEAATGIIAADRQLAERALGNLVENALRHGHGAIFCSFSEATLSVRNNGIISEEVQELVFDRLYRGAPDRSGDGHGLGLAIVKAISDLHGWTVQVDSASDEVVFSIHLRSPAKPEREY